MSDTVSGEQIFKPSDDVVVRAIEGQVVIVPLTAGVGDLEAELYSLNETGKAIWERLDGQTSVADVTAELQAEFEDAEGEIEGHVKGLLSELSRRGIVIDVAVKQ